MVRLCTSLPKGEATLVINLDDDGVYYLTNNFVSEGALAGFNEPARATAQVAVIFPCSVSSCGGRAFPPFSSTRHRGDGPRLGACGQ